MRLIDADNISNGIAVYLAENTYLNDTAQGALEMVAKWVKDAPTVDAVEVVRCRDCDDWREHGEFRICEHFSAIDLPGLCKNIKFATGPDDYCSFGFRIRRSETETEEIK